MCDLEEVVVIITRSNFLLAYIPTVPSTFTFSVVLALLGNTTSQNGARCGQPSPNGNFMLIKHICWV
jgi:hypothetical protein